MSRTFTTCLRPRRSAAAPGFFRRHGRLYSAGIQWLNLVLGVMDSEVSSSEHLPGVTVAVQGLVVPSALECSLKMPRSMTCWVGWRRYSEDLPLNISLETLLQYMALAVLKSLEMLQKFRED